MQCCRRRPASTGIAAGKGMVRGFKYPTADCAVKN